MMLAVNGIPVVAIELKNQLTGQSVDDAMRQWQYDRNPNEPASDLISVFSHTLPATSTMYI